MAKQVGFNPKESECDVNKTVEWNLSKVNQTCENDVVISNCSILEEPRTYLNPIEESDPDQIASVFKAGFPIAYVWLIQYESCHIWLAWLRLNLRISNLAVITGRVLFYHNLAVEEVWNYKLLLSYSHFDYVEPLLNHTSSTAKLG